MMRPEGDPQDGRAYWVADWGYARNMTMDYSIGATAFLGGLGEDRTQGGLRLRLVRWFGPYVSLDVSPGVLLADHERYTSFRRPGLSSQAGLSVGGRIGVVAQVFSVRRTEMLGWWYLPSTREVRETSWHLGIRLGAEPGIVGSLAFLVAESTLQSRTFAPPKP